MSAVLYYLIPVALAAVIIVLFLGLRNMAKGGPANLSQRFMRYRVIFQAIAVIIMMSALFFIEK